MVILHHVGLVTLILVGGLLGALGLIFFAACFGAAFDAHEAKKLNIPRWLAILVTFTVVTTLCGFGIHGIYTDAFHKD